MNSVGAPNNPPQSSDFPSGYFYVIGNTVTKSESNPPNVTAYLTTAYDPFTGTMAGSTAVPNNVVPPGYSPNLAPVAPTTLVTVPGKLNTMPLNIPPIASKQMKYYWICLRRPANPFAPPQPDISLVDANGHSTYNPMVVVDAMRFPFIEGGGTAGPPVTIGTNAIFSSQRCQPFRGGHAVRLPNDTSNNPAPLYTPYGYSEQMAVPVSTTSNGGKNNQGLNGGATGTPITSGTYYIHDTIGHPNDQAEPWDYFPFNDRDFTSVAELMLVPGCPPGLFTKQFVELAPMTPSSTALASPPTTFPVPQIIPTNPSATTPTSPYTDTAVSPAKVPGPQSPNAAVPFQAAAKGTIVQPHTYPYLVDKFFYSGYGGPVAGATIPPADPGGVVDGPGADGWFKMFEFFEVPSQSLGAIGAVAQGTNFDWARQDMKPGLLNLNLIIDEEVFFSVLGSQSIDAFERLHWHEHGLVHSVIAQLRAASRRQP